MAAAWEPGPASPPHPLGEVHLWRGEGRREAARAALAEVLSRYLGLEPAEIELERGEHGKPALPGDPPPLEFNLSHSAGLVLIAVTAGRPVGVDVRRRRSRQGAARHAAVDVGPGFAAAVAVAGPVVPPLRRYLLP